MKFLALATLFTALVGAVPAALEARDALPGNGGGKCSTKTVYKTEYKTEYKTKYQTQTEYKTSTVYKTEYKTGEF